MEERLQAAISRQYDLLSQEVLEIHARSDRMEQFFVLAVGAIYGFALTKEQSFAGYVYIVPTVMCYFAFIRLELLSRVRSIVRAKQIEFEKYLLEGRIVGAAEHFQKGFYLSDRPRDYASVSFRSLFERRISDRAKFWRVAICVSGALALMMNWSHLLATLDELWEYAVG